METGIRESERELDKKRDRDLKPIVVLAKTRNWVCLSGGLFSEKKVSCSSSQISLFFLFQVNFSSFYFVLSRLVFLLPFSIWVSFIFGWIRIDLDNSIAFRSFLLFILLNFICGSACVFRLVQGLDLKPHLFLFLFCCCQCLKWRWVFLDFVVA